MLQGLIAGILWAAATVFLSVALNMLSINSASQVISFAPFIGTFLHDVLSALLLLLYNVLMGNLKELFSVFKNPNFKWLLLASIIGGPVGMTGYVMSVNYLGASIGAVASAIYPAIGTLLACTFLKEKVRWYQWIFLLFTLCGVYGLSYSPGVAIDNIWLGLLGTCMCAFGWGVEAVILAKCFRNPTIKNEYALTIRQTVSALVYGFIILPLMDCSPFARNLFTGNVRLFWPTIAIAALCATISYLFYYKAISKIGASKAMALNITYTAWAILFTVVIIGDASGVNLKTVILAVIVVVCGILAAVDIKKLFNRKEERNH